MVRRSHSSGFGTLLHGQFSTECRKCGDSILMVKTRNGYRPFNYDPMVPKGHEQRTTGHICRRPARR